MLKSATYVGGALLVISLIVVLIIFKYSTPTNITEESISKMNIDITTSIVDTKNIKPLVVKPNKLEVLGKNKPKLAWSIDTNNALTEENGIRTGHAQMDVDILANLALGQTLIMDIPHINERYQVILDSTYNTLDDVEVWEGNINNGQPFESVAISRGTKETYMTVSTSNGVYSISANHKTGQIKIIDDGEVESQKTKGKIDVIEKTEFKIPPPD